MIQQQQGAVVRLTLAGACSYEIHMHPLLHRGMPVHGITYQRKLFVLPSRRCYRQRDGRSAFHGSAGWSVAPLETLQIPQGMNMVLACSSSPIDSLP